MKRYLPVTFWQKDCAKINLEVFHNFGRKIVANQPRNLGPSECIVTGKGFSMYRQ